jgi:formate hydrogenlyase subunit 3/multisubunit Na+/H+ antiporter MnhD subunit
MPVPMVASPKEMHAAHLSKAIHCAVVVRPSRAERHQREILRYVVLIIALMAVFLLIAIALYYTQGKSTTMEHSALVATCLEALA